MENKRIQKEISLHLHSTEFSVPIFTTLSQVVYDDAEMLYIQSYTYFLQDKFNDLVRNSNLSKKSVTFIVSRFRGKEFRQCSINNYILFLFVSLVKIFLRYPKAGR